MECFWASLSDYLWHYDGIIVDHLCIQMRLLLFCWSFCLVSSYYLHKTVNSLHWKILRYCSTVLYKFDKEDFTPQFSITICSMHRMHIYFRLHIELKMNLVPVDSYHEILIIRWNNLDFPLHNRNIERDILAQHWVLD